MSDDMLRVLKWMRRRQEARQAAVDRREALYAQAQVPPPQGEFVPLYGGHTPPSYSDSSGPSCDVGSSGDSGGGCDSGGGSD